MTGSIINISRVSKEFICPGRDRDLSLAVRIGRATKTFYIRTDYIPAIS